MKPSPKELRRRAAAVRLVLTDVDGVLTNGTIYHFVDTAGGLVEFKGIHAHDSIGMAWLAECGFVTGVISGRLSKGTEERLKILRVKHIYQHRLDKAVVLAEILNAEKLTAKEVVYVGDDLPDIQVMSRVGLAIAPSNARAEVKAAAHHVTRAAGGAGAFREVAELLLQAQGRWASIKARYK